MPTKDELVSGVGEIFAVANDAAGGLKTDLEQALSTIAEICTELDPTLQEVEDNEEEFYD